MQFRNHTLLNWNVRISRIAKRRSITATLTENVGSKNMQPNLGRRTFIISWLCGFSSKYMIPFTVDSLTSLHKSFDIESIIFVKIFVITREGISSQNKFRMRQEPSTATALTSGQSSRRSFSNKKNCLSNKVSFTSFVTSGSSSGNKSKNRCNAF